MAFIALKQFAFIFYCVFSFGLASTHQLSQDGIKKLTLNRMLKSRHRPERTFSEIHDMKFGSNDQSKVLNKMIIYDTIYDIFVLSVFTNQLVLCGGDPVNLCSAEKITNDWSFEKSHSMNLTIEVDNIKGLFYEITGDFMLHTKWITDGIYVLMGVGCPTGVIKIRAKFSSCILSSSNDTRFVCDVNDLEFLLFHGDHVDETDNNAAIFLCVALGGISTVFGIVGVNDFIKTRLHRNMVVPIE